MCHPYTKLGSFHASQKYGRTGQNFYLYPPRFKPTRSVMNKSGLLSTSDSFPWYPAKQCHQLTAITHPQRERILTSGEMVEHFPQLGVEKNCPRPAFSAIKHVHVRETTGKNDTLELIQINSAFQEVTHRDIPWG